ncbi:unnamed protein product [Rotaria sordida]|uniref:PiggyBac transposable element-derived protein domain-containing protein n=1 Tax=Rotaria sordida TaxID=392033 RepID=A0A815IYY4_9BILA|nr:unnamed protein product [Rotaria sordida]
MATCTTNDTHEIQMDSESEVDSDMEIDEVNSSDIDSDGSDDEVAPPKKKSTDRNWSKTAFEPHLFHFDEQNSGVSLGIHAMKNDTPLDFFELLFDEKMIDLIVQETNKYQDIFTNNATHQTASHQAK